MHAHKLACIKSQICALTRGKQKVKSEKDRQFLQQNQVSMTVQW